MKCDNCETEFFITALPESLKWRRENKCVAPYPEDNEFWCPVCNRLLKEENKNMKPTGLGTSPIFVTGHRRTEISESVIAKFAQHLDLAIQQLKLCKFECEFGPLELNCGFIAIERAIKNMIKLSQEQFSEGVKVNICLLCARMKKGICQYTEPCLGNDGPAKGFKEKPGKDQSGDAQLDLRRCETCKWNDHQGNCNSMYRCGTVKDFWESRAEQINNLGKVRVPDSLSEKFEKQIFSMHPLKKYQTEQLYLAIRNRIMKELHVMNGNIFLRETIKK